MVIFTWPKHSKYTPSKIIKLLFKVFISWCIEGLSQQNCEIQKQIVAKSCMRFCFFFKKNIDCNTNHYRWDLDINSPENAGWVGTCLTVETWMLSGRRQLKNEPKNART
jgi:hypothetical protein